jgi:hypothetical protein
MPTPENPRWQQLFASPAGRDDPPVFAMVGSTAVRAHRAAAGARAGQQNQAIGRFRGDRTTRLDAIAGGQGRS